MSLYIFSPFVSLVTSVILFFGCFETGKILFTKFKIHQSIESVSIPEFQYTTIGIVIISILIFPLVAFTGYAEIVLRSIAFILLFLGIRFLFTSKYIFLKINFKNSDLYFYIYILVLTLYFFIALSPLTAADVLDYHTGMAINILRLNQYLLLPEWFTGLQSGHGEPLIALGLSVKAEQFGSLVQFSSLLSISGIIIKFSRDKLIYASKYFIILTILSCPILIFLLSGNKPQIFYSSLLFLSFSLNFTKNENIKTNIISYLIINILICICVMGKFSFNLTGALIWIYSTINFVKKTNVKILLIPVLVFFMLFLPFIYWKFINLGGSIYGYFFSPFPLHLPGYETFLSHNKGSQEIPFPNFLFYTSLSRITEFLAMNPIFFVILLFYFKEKKEIQIILILSSIFIIISNTYASPSARYYLDIILWLTFAIILLNNVKLIKYLKILFFPQILIVLIILLYSNYNFLPGSFTVANYQKVKNRYAYLYSGFEWLNENIPDDSKILIINRPISLYKSFAVSGGFNYFTNKDESIYYKKLIKDYKLDYIAYLGNDENLMHLKNCTNGIYKKKKNIGYHATRNPFNRGGNYNGYIYYIDNNKLPNC